MCSGMEKDRSTAPDVQPRGFREPSSTIGWLFDAISIQFLDRLPNPVTVATIASLFMAAHAMTAVMVYAFVGVKDQALLCLILTMASGAIIIPIVGFGQMQYRRARASYFRLESLTRELTEARDEAQAANTQKSQFLASMSHELRTPLNAIIGFSEVIKKEFFGGITNRRYVDYACDIHKSGEHLLSLISDVLDLSRIESGKPMQQKDTEIDPVWLVRDSVEMLRIMAEKNGVGLIFHSAVPALRISANERMIRQILLNLISNAIKFTTEGGRVQVTTAVGSDGLEIEVKDSGIGMTQQEQEIALQAFGQIDSFQARKHNGTGLGLPLAKAMVAAHQGKLEISSARGVGTTVRFNIPAHRLIGNVSSFCQPEALAC
jgi:signal transduction histidine kinase